jgi:hypothetical protein
VHAVREDIKRADLLFAGTEHGVYASFDNGASWQSIAGSLPDTEVPDLAVTENDLTIATHGRSFYVLDDIAALRQMTPEVLRSQLYVFRPSDAVRPRRQTAVYYHLGQAAQDVQIDILDAAGRVIRTAKPRDTRRGTNRFVWDLRYPGATVFEGMVLRGANPERGPIAPPGDYSVRISALGTNVSRPLRVVRDPRLMTASDADLQAQFKLAIEVRDKTSQANQMVIAIREFKKQITERTAAAEVFENKLSRLEEELYQVRNRSPRDTLNYPIKLNNQLAFLMEVVESGDYRPTDQTAAVLRELSARLAALQAQFDAIKASYRP